MLKDKTVIVFDHGGYVEVTKTLSKEFGKVYYYTPWETGFPTSNDTLVGSGFKEFERINHFWDYVEKADLIVFTDIYHGDLQEYLERIGKRVWGAKEGDTLEISRYDFFMYLEKIGLPIPPTQLVVGIDNLRKYLKNNDNNFVKVDSMFRGDIETFHHINYEITEPILDKLEYKIGVRKNSIRFIVQEPIPTKAEIGYDGYTVDGEFPESCLFGIEVKDKGYVGEVRKYSDIPKEIKQVNDALSATLKKYKYRGNISTEIRVGEDGKPYLIDITCRCPAPPTAVMLELIDNWGEIMYEGANGKLIEPVFNAKFGAECIGLSEFAKEHNFAQIFYPDNIKQWVKQPYSCVVDGKTYVIPQSWENARVCEIVAIGDNLEDTIKTLQYRCNKIKGHQLTLDCSVLNDAIDDLKNL